MEFGAHLPLISFAGEQRSLDDLLGFTEAARDLGYTHLCANDHLVFTRPWLDGPTALAARPGSGRYRRRTMTTTTAADGPARTTPGNGETREHAHRPTQLDAGGTISGPQVTTPRRRRLRTFAFDPMSTRLSGRYLTISVPYETGLGKGPQGRLLRVVDYDPLRESWYSLVDLDDAFILAQDGLQPSEGDPRSHQQIVYAVASSVIERFERYLGRRFRWRGKAKLALVPHAFEGRNAYSDPNRKAVLFGYYRADANDPGANLPGQVIFTCLSSDIIAHEVTHAIVHRLRPFFAEATNADVFAWHEAFADLIALFQHFAYREVVLEAIASTSGSLEKGRAPRPVTNVRDDQIRANPFFFNAVPSQGQSFYVFQ